MRKVLFFLAFALTFGVTTGYAGGGPDAYGYTWLDSNDGGGPTFSWIDISTMSGATQVTGMGDDDSKGPFSMGWDFHYYWSDYNEVKIGSNGWVGFNNIGNISHCFPTVPTAGGSGDNFLAPFMTDINPAGASNPCEIWYWSNNVDSFIVSFHNAPWWTNSNPDYIGDNSFQVILSGADSSITFQYLQTDPGNFNDQAGCAADIEIGIENITGNIGLECYNETVPTSNYAIKFYYPGTVTFQVPDATPAWAANTDNAGQFYLTGANVDMKANVENVGNADIATDIAVSGNLQSLALNTVWSDNAVVTGGLTAGSNSTVTFSNQANLATAGQYYYNVSVSNASDINPSNNNTTVEVSAVEPNGSVLPLTYCTMNNPDGAIAWSGGGGNDGCGIHIVPPGYPAVVKSVDLFIFGDDGDTLTPMIAGFDVNILDDDGTNGMPGTTLHTETISAANATEDNWNYVTLSSPVTINSGGFYVSWIMGADGVALGTEAFGPISRRTYEILGGSWAQYRQYTVEDFLIVVNIDTAGIVAAVEDVYPANQFDVYPNPASNSVMMAYDLTHSGNVNLTITNMFGQTVWTREHAAVVGNQYNQSIDLSGFANGVYFVNLVSNGQKMTKKLVVSH